MMNERTTVLSKLTAARKKMAAFVMEHSGAQLDDTAILRGEHVMVSGAPIECALVVLWANRLGMTATMARPEADDPEWTFVLIPLADAATLIGRVS